MNHKILLVVTALLLVGTLQKLAAIGQEVPANDNTKVQEKHTATSNKSSPEKEDSEKAYLDIISQLIQSLDQKTVLFCQYKEQATRIEIQNQTIKQQETILGFYVLASMGLAIWLGYVLCHQNTASDDLQAYLEQKPNPLQLRWPYCLCRLL
jgi:hypothetical protein